MFWDFGNEAVRVEAAHKSREWLADAMEMWLRP